MTDRKKEEQMNIDFGKKYEPFREIRQFLDDNLTDELKDAQRNLSRDFLDYEYNIEWPQILFKQVGRSRMAEGIWRNGLSLMEKYI